MQNVQMKVFLFMVWVALCGLFYVAKLNIPKDGRTFINQIFESYNEQDYKTIYRDLSSGRFKASADYYSFKKVMESLHKNFGLIENRKQSDIMWDAYKENKFLFYRIEFQVHHKKGDTYQRMVIMNQHKSNEWTLDGLAIASSEEIYLAQGNLYFFDWASKKNISVWSPEKMKNIFKDSRSDYLKTNPYSNSWLSNFIRKIRIIIRI